MMAMPEWEIVCKITVNDAEEAFVLESELLFEFKIYFKNVVQVGLKQTAYKVSFSRKTV